MSSWTCGLSSDEKMFQSLVVGEAFYSVYCILPLERALRFVKHAVEKVESPSPITISSQLIILRTNEHEQGIEISLHELGEKLAFTYSSRLIFLHEKDYRNLVLLLSIDNENIYGLEKNYAAGNIGELLNAGSIAKGLSVRYVGYVGSIYVGYGLFAERDINNGDFIGEYTGLVRESVKNEEDNAYSFVYPSSECSYDINAKEYGSVIRFINHHSISPNVEFKRVFHEGLMHIVCFAITDISKDSQLLVDYGAAYWVNKRYCPVVL